MTRWPSRTADPNAPRDLAPLIATLRERRNALATPRAALEATATQPTGCAALPKQSAWFAATTEDIGRQVVEVPAATKDAISAVTAIADAVGKMDHAAGAIASASEQHAMTRREIADIVSQTVAAASRVSSSISRVATESASTSGRIADVRAETQRVEAAVSDLRCAGRRGAPLDAGGGRRGTSRFTPAQPLRAQLAGKGDDSGQQVEVADISITGVALLAARQYAPGTHLMLRLIGIGVDHPLEIIVQDTSAVRLRGCFAALPEATQQRSAAHIAQHQAHRAVGASDSRRRTAPV